MVELETKSRTLSFAFPSDFFSKSSKITILPGRGMRIEQQFLCDEDAVRLNNFKHDNIETLQMPDGWYYDSFISNPVDMYMDDPHLFFAELEGGRPGTYYVDVMYLHRDYVRLFKQVSFF